MIGTIVTDHFHLPGPESSILFCSSLDIDRIPITSLGCAKFLGSRVFDLHWSSRLFRENGCNGKFHIHDHFRAEATSHMRINDPDVSNWNSKNTGNLLPLRMRSLCIGPDRKVTGWIPFYDA